MKNRTTLQVEKETLTHLKSLKKYPRETNEDVLIRLIQGELNKDNNIQDVETFDTSN